MPTLEPTASDQEQPFAHSWLDASANVRVTRQLLLRALGFIYAVGFAIVLRQWLPLLGEHGLMPVPVFLQRVASEVGDVGAWRIPSLFWLNDSDTFALALGWVGWVASLLAMLGLGNAPLMGVLWVIYSSFVHVGQTFYGYGWETLLLEAGFLAIFLAPVWRPDPHASSEPPLPVIWLYRWLVFRLMFGAGLIKIRGDECWRDLTCLLYHYETQPNPHPLSWLVHQAPSWFHTLGVSFNHFAELIVPFGVFGPRRVRHAAGAITIVFQFSIILSGNLSFLNWLTIVVALACFDDSLLQRVLPRRVCEPLQAPPLRAPSRARHIAIVLLCSVVGLLSLNPVANMLGPRQRMNASFEPFDLVNTYGAFGTVGKVRDEVIIEGTDGDPNDPAAEWLSYEFPCKPGATDRAPCTVTPYHHRLAWQMWFAGFSNIRRQPWLVHLVSKLLDGDADALSLVENNPFDGAPPAYIRISHYRYRFTHFGEAGWWQRERRGDYMPAMSRDDPRLRAFLHRYGWR